MALTEGMPETAAGVMVFVALALFAVATGRRWSDPSGRPPRR